MTRTAAGLLAAQAAITGAWAGGCASAIDTAALKVAALQQELMVAAFSCHDVRRYNDFVLAHQPELIRSDAVLKSFFVHRTSEAAYHTYKTELANGASLRSIRDADAFCGQAEDAFAAADGQASLADTFGGWHWAAASTLACPGTELQTASAAPPPVRTPWRERSALVSDGDAIPAPSRDDGEVPAPRRRHSGDAMSAGMSAPAPHRRLDDTL
ncbi:MAG: hypothetical protein WDM91_21805 [Rhizomicrobium sp.]